MYRLIEDEWFDGTAYNVYTHKDEPVKCASDDDYGLTITIKEIKDSFLVYEVSCELGNGFSKDDYCNSIDEVIEWIKEEIEDCLQIDYENIFYEEIPDDEIEDDNEDYSLFSKEELKG